jgi:hypothetical protein
MFRKSQIASDNFWPEADETASSPVFGIRPIDIWKIDLDFCRSEAALMARMETKSKADKKGRLFPRRG